MHELEPYREVGKEHNNPVNEQMPLGDAPRPPADQHSHGVLRRPLVSVLIRRSEARK